MLGLKGLNINFEIWNFSGSGPVAFYLLRRQSAVLQLPTSQYPEFSHPSSLNFAMSQSASARDKLFKDMMDFVGTLKGAETIPNRVAAQGGKDLEDLAHATFGLWCDSPEHWKGQDYMEVHPWMRIALQIFHSRCMTMFQRNAFEAKHQDFIASNVKMKDDVKTELEAAGIVNVKLLNMDGKYRITSKEKVVPF